MLNESQAQKFSLEAQTSVDNVLKEHYQVYLLDILFSSPFAGELVFKGGTALRLAYNSFRFSEDLDFSSSKAINYKLFEKTVLTVPKKFPEVSIKDLYNKRYNYFARLTFEVDYKSVPIGIKIELNKDTKRKLDYKVALMKSPFNNLEVTGNVFTLEQILEDKKLTLKERRAPRDLFDTWYICQKLGIDFKVPAKIKYTRKEVEQSLHYLLPKKYRMVVSELL
ncbi:MAG: nucleotidyl transferase AbiEii/AbiGii toxin family protein [bacterium]